MINGKQPSGPATALLNGVSCLWTHQCSRGIPTLCERCFADMLDVSVVVYLDDILIYSNDPAEHRQHVREVLRRLRANGLYCKGSKCEFHRDSVEYLGYILSLEGLCMSEDKVKAILDWPVPRKVKDIQSFLGFANFYRRFIHEYSDIVIPLTRLTRKGTPWKFNDKCMAAFNELKQAFTSRSYPYPLGPRPAIGCGDQRL